MRSALLLLVAVTGGCIPIHSYVNGTASYTGTPPLAGASGALPLHGVFCAALRGKSEATLRLGDDCLLRGPWAAAPHVRGGSAQLTSDGACALPFANGVSPLPVRVRVRVEQGTLTVLGESVDAVVGGVTAEGTYVTYRFTGNAGDEAPEEACTGLNVSAPVPEAAERVHVAPGGSWQGGDAPRP